MMKILTSAEISSPRASIMQMLLMISILAISPTPKVAQNSTVLVGRKQDGVFDLRDDPAPHLKLEYLDADGQQLRPKEAHRLMSYIFHGRKPHQKKLEKLARQKEEARRVAEMESTDTPLHAVAAMERLQQETHQPYLVLSGKGAQNAFLNLKKE